MKVKKIIKIFIVVCILLIALLKFNLIKDFIVHTFSPAIEFENSYFNLRAGQWLGFSYGEKITEYDANKVEDLYISSLPLSDLKYFPKLKRLTAENVDNDGIKEISKCTNLEILALGGDFTDLKPLESLQNIKSLSLFDNNVKDFSPIGKLTQLEQLTLIGKEAENIEFLSDLTKLEILTMSYMNNVTDISPLKNLANLKRLDLEVMKNLQDISPISKLLELINLRILQCPKVEDISAIQNLDKLKIFQLSDTGVTDISVLGDLSEFPNLIRLPIDEEQIVNKEQLKIIKQVLDSRDKSNNEYYWKYNWYRRP